MQLLGLMLLSTMAEAFVLINAPVHRSTTPHISNTVVTMQESLEKISKITFAGTCMGVVLVGGAAYTSAQGSPPGGLAVAALALLIMKLAADKDELEMP